jgi:hypothetical protein
MSTLLPKGDGNSLSVVCAGARLTPSDGFTVTAIAPTARAYRTAATKSDAVSNAAAIRAAETAGCAALAIDLAGSV